LIVSALGWQRTLLEAVCIVVVVAAVWTDNREPWQITTRHCAAIRATTLGLSAGIGVFFSRHVSTRVELDFPHRHASHISTRNRALQRIEVSAMREEGGRRRSLPSSPDIFVRRPA
jgi:hypothetical protein